MTTLGPRTLLRKAAIDRGVRLATGRYGCRYRGSQVERFWMGHSVSFIVYTGYRVFFQEDMCYLSDKLFRVCDLEKHYKLQVL